MNNTLLFIIIMAMTIGIEYKALASGDTPNMSYQIYEEQPYDRNHMTEAILQKLTIWTNEKTGERFFHVSCRKSKQGCAKQISQLVDYVFDISAKENFNPWLLAALAWHESNFYPFAISHCGAVGMVQLLARSPWSKGITFVHDENYRNICKNKLGACQEEVIERGVFHLKKSFEICGSVKDGLRRYNSGKCTGPKKYPKNVFREMNDIMKRADKLSLNYCI